MIDHLQKQLTRKDDAVFCEIRESFGIFHMLVNISALSEALNEAIIAGFRQEGRSEAYEIALGQKEPDIAQMVRDFDA